MKRWGITIDDSGGVPLSRTPSFIFINLVARAAKSALEPPQLLSLLKHPLPHAAWPAHELRDAARWLERKILRPPRAQSGLDPIEEALREEGLQGSPIPKHVQKMIAHLKDIFSPLLAMMQKEKAVFGEILKLHLQAAQEMAGDGRTPGTARLWGDTHADTRAAARFFSELFANQILLGEISTEDYPHLLETFAKRQLVRQPYGQSDRLFLWGPLEARLQEVDLVILGGLSEGVWPSSLHQDPWLNRSMHDVLGLPPAESALGLAAHDFVQNLGTKRAVLTHALKNEQGYPQAPSRWLLRLGERRQKRRHSVSPASS